jgi:hypothetical protein
LLASLPPNGRVNKLKPSVKADIQLATKAGEFLDASAVLWDKERQAWRGIAEQLKAWGVHKGDFEQKSRQRWHELQVEEKNREKAAKIAAAAGAPPKAGSGSALKLRDVTPWDQPVDGTQLLTDLVARVRRYVVLPVMAAEAIALYVVFTYTIAAFETVPRLALLSAVMRSGKTKLLSVLMYLVRRGLSASNISVPSFFRTIEKADGTIAIDEADASLAANDEIRGLIDSGHTRDAAHVIRCEGDDHEPRQLSTWAPIIIAAIGKLPRTIMDRSIVIRMRRRKSQEPVERFGRKARKNSELEALARKCQRWANDNLATLELLEPLLPEQLDDRAADSWEPLFAIADLCDPNGTGWSMLARQSALVLSGVEAKGDDEPLGILLLSDLRDIFEKVQEQVDDQGNPDKRMSSEAVCKALHALTERPWPEYGRSEKPISQRQLASLLRDFQVKPKNLRSGRTIVKGYSLRDGLGEAFERNLPPLDADEPVKTDPSAATPLQPNEIKGNPAFSIRYTNGTVADGKSHSGHGEKDCSAVADRKTPNGAGAEKEGSDTPTEYEVREDDEGRF